MCHEKTKLCTSTLAAVGRGQFPSGTLHRHQCTGHQCTPVHEHWSPVHDMKAKWSRQMACLSLALLAFITIKQLLKKYKESSEEGASDDGNAMDLLKSESVVLGNITNINRIFNSLQAIKMNHEDFKVTASLIEDHELSSFLIRSHFMARKIYQLSTLSSREVEDGDGDEGVRVIGAGKQIGTLVYNRINKSGSTSLLSR